MRQRKEHTSRKVGGGGGGGGGAESRETSRRSLNDAGEGDPPSVVYACAFSRPLPSCGCVLPRAYSGSCLSCTLARSSDKTLFHSPSTMPYQSPDRGPDRNSLPNLNLHADEQISLLFPVLHIPRTPQVTQRRKCPRHRKRRSHPRPQTAPIHGGGHKYK